MLHLLAPLALALPQDPVLPPEQLALIPNGVEFVARLESLDAWEARTANVEWALVTMSADPGFFVQLGRRGISIENPPPGLSTSRPIVFLAHSSDYGISSLPDTTPGYGWLLPADDPQALAAFLNERITNRVVEAHGDTVCIWSHAGDFGEAGVGRELAENLRPGLLAYAFAVDAPPPDSATERSAYVYQEHQLVGAHFDPFTTAHSLLLESTGFGDFGDATSADLVSVALHVDADRVVMDAELRFSEGDPLLELLPANEPVDLASLRAPFETGASIVVLAQGNFSKRLDEALSDYRDQGVALYERLADSLAKPEDSPWDYAALAEVHVEFCEALGRWLVPHGAAKAWAMHFDARGHPAFEIWSTERSAEDVTDAWTGLLGTRYFEGLGWGSATVTRDADASRIELPIADPKLHAHYAPTLPFGLWRSKGKRLLTPSIVQPTGPWTRQVIGLEKMPPSVSASGAWTMFERGLAGCTPHALAELRWSAFAGSIMGSTAAAAEWAPLPLVAFLGRRQNWVRVGVGVDLRNHRSVEAAMAAQPSAELSRRQRRAFDTDLAPILAASCTSCHGPERQAGGLRLDDIERLMAGSDRGPVYRDEARLESPLLRVLDDPASPGHQVTASDRAALEAWLRGAAD